MPRTQRARSARALANDAAIRAAGVAEVLRVGVDHLSLRDVGHRAGLTHGATYARYEDVDELLVDLWNSTMLARAVALYDLCAALVREPNAERAADLRRWVTRAEPADVACFQVLFTARRLPTLHEEVEPFIDEYLIGRWARPDLDPAVGLRVAALFTLSLVMLAAANRFGSDDDLDAAFYDILVEGLSVPPATVRPVPTLAPPAPFSPPPSDDLRTQLAVATFGVVGRSGYTRATISRIARRANCSPGAIYKLFASKEDLAIEAMRTVMRTRILAPGRSLDITREGWFTEMLLDAVAPVNHVRALFNLEMTIAGAQNERIRAAILARLTELESVASILAGLTDEERVVLRRRLRVGTFMISAMGYLSTLGAAPSEAELHAFAEPMRRALVAGRERAWRAFDEQVGELARARGE
ncbi:MAG TPA: TetR/AcrR family transcriptional regulator [Acidimicrobiales bacterium]|nr:TetR/AcrR family transcriptional regulator [Acidimicrobiales bacterium]